MTIGLPYFLRFVDHFGKIWFFTFGKYGILSWALTQHPTLFIRQKHTWIIFVCTNCSHWNPFAVGTGVAVLPHDDAYALHTYQRVGNSRLVGWLVNTMQIGVMRKNVSRCMMICAETGWPGGCQFYGSRVLPNRVPIYGDLIVIDYVIINWFCRLWNVVCDSMRERVSNWRLWSSGWSIGQQPLVYGV